MADPYRVLGVDKSAGQDEIRKAYRRLVKECHPDLHPGDQAAEKRFKDVSAAYGIIGDKDRRARFDRGEIDEAGAERPRQEFYRSKADGEPGFKYHTRSDFQEFGDLGDIFSDLFGGRQGEFKARGADLRYALSVGFLEAVNGARKRIQLPDGKSLDVSIPAGLRDGQTLRLRGRGQPGIGGASAGDALVTVNVMPHPELRRDGDNIRSNLDISLPEAVLGARVEVSTVTGPVGLNVPKGSNSGTVLRLRGKGVLDEKTGRRGDHLVELRVVLPRETDPELESFVAGWQAGHRYDPRKQMERSS